jgi:hypothetical protein
VFLENEDKFRELIRDHLREHKTKTEDHPLYKMSGTGADSKLDERIPISTDIHSSPVNISEEPE